MQPALPALRPLETLTLALRRLYEQYGYAAFSMTHMEEYAFYIENRNFLEQPEIAVFSDLDGRLLALKPDVTLSIVRSVPVDNTQLQRLYYAENVFRASAQAGGFRELSQMGLECIGCVTEYAVAVDSVEAVTGIDFFSQLPDSVEERLEAVAGCAAWLSLRPAAGSENGTSADGQPSRAVQCKGIAKSTGKRCRSMTRNANGYCNAHQSQAR